MAGDLAWLYVAFNVTQAQNAELWLVQDPAELPWRETRPATRSPGRARGVRHMAAYSIDSDHVVAAGVQADLVDLVDDGSDSKRVGLPSWIGPHRD